MGFFLLPENIRELWKQWELRLLVLLSLFLQLTLASQGSRRKSIVKNWIQIVVWTTYLLADSIATLTLGVLSHRLASIEETKGVIDPASQITAFWAPFLLLHLGGPDTVTAYALADNELWLRQLARLCVQLGLAGYIYSMALSESTLWMLAEGMILVGLIKYAERSLCLYLASRDPLRDSMLPRPDVVPIYSRITEQYTLKKDEGYRVRVDEITQISGPKDLTVNSNQDPLVQAYKLFKIFKLLFAGLTVNSIDLDVSRRMFMDQDMGSGQAFKIVEIELSFMYDLLFTKAPLLNCTWGIIRWVVSLSVPVAVLVFFSLQDKKEYPTVDISITFLLMSVAVLLEIHSLLQVISSDWIHHWRLQRRGRSAISSAVALLQFSPSQRWSNSVAQFHLLSSSIRTGKSIFRHPSLAKLHMLVEKNFYIDYKNFDQKIKVLIFDRLRAMAISLEQTVELESGLASLKLEARHLLRRSNCDHLNWSVDGMEFDQSLLIWHIATELCYSKDGGGTQAEDIMNSEMSMLVSRYMLYLVVFYPSMLPTGIGLVRYEDTLVEAQKFFDDKLVTSSSRVLNDPRKLCHLLLQVTTELPARKLRGAKSTSVLFEACRLARQLRSVDTWDIISKVWVRMLAYAAYECKDYEHCASLSRGGELLTHVWLLMAHLGVAQPVQTSREPIITKLIVE